jgi:peptidyl-prolyl cis-trans isomerase SurA
MTGAQLLTALAGNGVGADTLLAQLRAQISWQRWISGRYGGNRLRIGQDQINATLLQIEAQTEKPQYHIDEIYLDAGRAGGVAQAQSGAQQLIAQLQQGAPFAAVARQFSAANTAANGGDAGWLSESQLRPEVSAVIAQMHPGELSQPILVKDGVYVFFLQDKRSGEGAEMVSLKQAAISLPPDAPTAQVDAAKRKLAALKLQITGCSDFEAKAAKVDGVVADDLGEAETTGLRPEFRDAIGSLQPGDVSNPIRTNVGVHLVAVCGKRRGGVTLPTREQIEAHLEDEQLSLISRRYLRDLHSSATIDVRQ